VKDDPGLDAFWHEEIGPVLEDLARALELRRRLLTRRLAAFSAMAAVLLPVSVAAGAPWPWLACPAMGAAGLHILLQRLAPPGRDYRDAVRAGVLAPLCRRLGAELAAGPVPVQPGWIVRAEIRPGDAEPVLLLEKGRGWGWPWMGAWGAGIRTGAIAQRRGAGIRMLWQGPRIPFELRSPTDLGLLRSDAERLAGALRRRRSPG
jgi:hypothetical protein